MILNTKGKLNIEQAIALLDQKWKGGKACPVCGNNSWNINPDLAELRFLSVEAFVVGGPVIPVAVVTCNNCGNTLLFNAMRLGWIPPAQPEGSPTGGAH